MTGHAYRPAYWQGASTERSLTPLGRFLARIALPMPLRLTGFQKLALSTVLVTYVMIVIGVIVRSTGSGMGCPDWPLCHGQVIPALGDSAAWIESVHRWWGVIVGFFVLALTVAAWRGQRRTRSIPVASVATLVLVGFQAWLGKWTVETGNSGESVVPLR